MPQEEYEKAYASIQSEIHDGTASYDYFINVSVEAIAEPVLNIIGCALRSKAHNVSAHTAVVGLFFVISPMRAYTAIEYCGGWPGIMWSSALKTAQGRSKPL
ncbi:hypothetical protein PGS49_20715 [Yersinia intermedia]|uniref:hypothetical protein n=1 Tax=Yersinia intermedia TaxID=631 RepID=UPI0022FEA83C|nr:hypothetical protein [Yersinia intermedia]MDA5483049.1 hypothetical protein [Yersinia intermedia]